MSSSTSSSERRAVGNSTANDRRPDRVTSAQWWSFAITLLVLGVAAESVLRARGAKPQQTDSVDLWSVHLSEALDRGDTARTIVVLGASRAQLGFDPEVFQRELDAAGHKGWKLVLLAANGRDPKPLLAYLADRGFRGFVLCSFDAEWVFRVGPNGTEAWIHHYQNYYYRGWPVDRMLNMRCRMFIQSLLVIVRNRSERDLQVWLEQTKVPLELQETRHYKAMYAEQMTPEELVRYVARQERVARRNIERARVQLSRWDEDLEALKVDVERLKKIASGVVFLRFPTAGVYREVHDELLPRAQYWDRMISALDVPSLHFEDIGDLDGLELPDGGAHLDHRSAEVFTQRLCRALAEKEWIPPLVD